jgi:hypothetical protein
MTNIYVFQPLTCVSIAMNEPPIRRDYQRNKC